MSIQKIKNIGYVDEIVFQLQSQYSEKLFSRLYNAVKYKLLEYNKYSFLYLTKEDKEDVLQDVLSTTIFTSIEKYNRKTNFLSYVNNIFRKRLITKTNQKIKNKTISITKMEEFETQEDISTGKSVITDNKEILYKKYIDTEMSSRIEKEKVENFISNIINSLQEIDNKDYRYVIYAILIFDFKKLQNLLNLFSELYKVCSSTIYTRSSRAFEKLSKILNHKVDRKLMLQVNRFISIKDEKIKEIVCKFKFTKYNGNIIEVYKILEKIDKKRENGIHEILEVIV